MRISILPNDGSAVSDIGCSNYRVYLNGVEMRSKDLYMADSEKGEIGYYPHDIDDMAIPNKEQNTAIRTVLRGDVVIEKRQSE